MSDIYQDINEYINFPQEIRQQHLNLKEECVEIGGDSRSFRGILSYYLRITIPKGMKIHLCHACHNDKCSNPKHLYWGTPSENEKDAYSNGKITWNKGKKCPQISLGLKRKHEL